MLFSTGLVDDTEDDRSVPRGYESHLERLTATNLARGDGLPKNKAVPKKMQESQSVKKRHRKDGIFSAVINSDPLRVLSRMNPRTSDISMDSRQSSRLDADESEEESPDEDALGDASR